LSIFKKQPQTQQNYLSEANGDLQTALNKFFEQGGESQINKKPKKEEAKGMDKNLEDKYR